MYVLQVKGGKENVVKAALQKAGYHALVPIENRMIRTAGKWTQKEYVLFPNYVFIETEYNADNFYRITSMDYIINFLGNRFDPSRLSFMEVEWIRILANAGKPLEPTIVRFDKDNNPYIVKGVLDHFKSRVKTFNKRQKKAVFEITVLNEIKEITLSIEVIDESSEDIKKDTSED